MRNLFRNHSKQQGFTIVELLTTLAILAVFYGLIVANYSRWRGPQYIRLSATEVATQLNKMRSYALSARNFQGSPVKLYIMEFCTNSAETRCDGRNADTPVGPDEYRVHFIGSDASGGVSFTNNNGSTRDLEVFSLPGTAKIEELLVVNAKGEPLLTNCVQVAFSLPYGRTFIDPYCRFDDNTSLSETDPLKRNPFFTLPELDSLANSRLGITVGWDGGEQKKIVSVDGVSGRVASFDALECDVWPRGSGDGVLTNEDFTQVSIFSTFEGTTTSPLRALNGTEFQKADCGPTATAGDGVLNVQDSSASGSYVSNSVPTKAVGGPSSR